MPYLPPCLVLYPTVAPEREHNFQIPQDLKVTRRGVGQREVRVQIGGNLLF